MCDEKCVCKGTFRSVVDELNNSAEGKLFVREDGKVFTLEGILYGRDDIYYYLVSTNDCEDELVSCVSSLENFGFIVYDN